MTEHFKEVTPVLKKKLFFAYSVFVDMESIDFEHLEEKIFHKNKFSSGFLEKLYLKTHQKKKQQLATDLWILRLHILTNLSAQSIAQICHKKESQIEAALYRSLFKRKRIELETRQQLKKSYFDIQNTKEFQLKKNEIENDFALFLKTPLFISPLQKDEESTSNKSTILYGLLLLFSLLSFIFFNSYSEKVFTYFKKLF